MSICFFIYMNNVLRKICNLLSGMIISSFKQDLLARFNHGDRQAFSEIYNEYYTFTYTVVKRVTAGSSYTKDLVADSFVKLLQYKGEFKSLSKIKSFLFVTARNISLDYLRNKKTKQNKTISFQDWMCGLRDTEEATQTIAEHRKIIYDSIQSLPHQCRQIFTLYYFEELRNPEIASLLNISKKTVANQKNTARRILKLKISILKINSFLFSILLLPLTILPDCLRWFFIIHQ